MTAKEPTGARLARLLEVDTSSEVRPPPPNWKSEPGDTLTGIFIKWVIVTSNLEKKHRIAIIEDRSGIRHSLWCSPTTLRSEMKRKNPMPGDGITIERKADRDTGKPHPLKVFRVTVKRDSGSPTRADWNLEGGTR